MHESYKKRNLIFRMCCKGNPTYNTSALYLVGRVVIVSYIKSHRDEKTSVVSFVSVFV